MYKNTHFVVKSFKEYVLNNLKPTKHQHYYHTHSDFFNHPLDLSHAFLMDNYQIGMHEQEFFEINVITKGKGIHFIGENSTNAKEGDVFIIPPNLSHGYVGGEGFDVFHVIISDSFMIKNLAELQQLPSFFMLFGAEPLMRGKTEKSLHLSLSQKNFSETVTLLKQIASLNDYNDPFECLKRNNLTMVAITALCENYTKDHSLKKQTKTEDLYFMESISFIHGHYFEKITISDLIKLAHLSRTAYIQKFKEILKVPPLTYVTNLRIESSLSMLVNTNLSISEIAFRTGFYDGSHFTKAFEKKLKISPIEYRKKYSKLT